MVSTRKKKQQNKRPLSQLDESDTLFVIGQNNHAAQAGSKTNMVNIGSSSSNMKGPIQVNSSQVDMHTVEENFVSKVQSEVDNVMVTVEIRLQDAVLTAIESLVIPRVQLAMKSANVFSRQNVDGNMSEPDQRDFWVISKVHK